MSVTTRTAVAAGFMTAALTFGCGGGDKPEAEAPRTTLPAATMAAPPSIPAAATGDFGVAECDAYMKKYIACVESKVPEAQRAMMRQQLEQNKMAWQQAAATPYGKASLATGCKQADQASGPAMKAYGCAW